MIQVPPSYRQTNRFRSKAFRKGTKIEVLNARIKALEGFAEIQAEKAQQLADLTKKLVDKLAEMEIKVIFNNGEVQFESIHQSDSGK